MSKLLPLVLALALFAGACGGGEGGVVATVDGTDITLDDVRSMTSRTESLEGEEFRQILSRLIILRALENGLQNDLGTEIDEEEVDAVYETLLAGIEQQGLTIEEALGQPGANAESLRFNARVTVLRNVVTQAEVGDPRVVEALLADPRGITTVCVRHILVETPEEAETVIERLEAEEDFALLAEELSLDSGTPGGDLGCSLASRYVEEFAEASMTGAVGELVGPIETQFGFHVLIIDERTTPTEEEIAANPQNFLTADEANTLWVEWLNERLRESEISVESKYGTWSNDGLGILPPE